MPHIIFPNKLSALVTAINIDEKQISVKTDDLNTANYLLGFLIDTYQPLNGIIDIKNNKYFHCIDGYTIEMINENEFILKFNSILQKQKRLIRKQLIYFSPDVDKIFINQYYIRANNFTTNFTTSTGIQIGDNINPFHLNGNAINITRQRNNDMHLDFRYLPFNSPNDLLTKYKKTTWD